MKYHKAGLLSYEREPISCVLVSSGHFPYIHFSFAIKGETLVDWPFDTRDIPPM